MSSSKATKHPKKRFFETIGKQFNPSSIIRQFVSDPELVIGHSELGHSTQGLPQGYDRRQLNRTDQSTSPMINTSVENDISLSISVRDTSSIGKLTPDVPELGKNLQDKPMIVEATKQKLRSSAKLTWNGFKLFSESVEGFLDGTPFKIPIGVLNTLIRIADKVIESKVSLLDLLRSIDDRFEAVSRNITMDGQCLINTQSSYEHFTQALVCVRDSLNEMEKDGMLKRILQSNDHPSQIEHLFKQVDEATKTFVLELTLVNIRLTQDIKQDTEILRLSSLRPFLEASYAQVNHRACTKGTRETTLKDVLTWCQDPSSDSPPIFWLSGMAGTGKSTIAYTLCQQLCDPGAAKLLGASFFCSRQTPNGRKRDKIIPTIAHQLSQSFPPYGRCILSSKLDFSIPPTNDHVKSLLIDPWNTSINNCASIPPLVVVIDALDEIEDGEGSQFLGDLMSTISHHEAHRGLKFLVISRYDPRIVELCTSLPSNAIIRLQDVDSIIVEEDIHLYLQKSLPNLDSSQLLNLAIQASGLFIYAATAVRIIYPSLHHASPLEIQKKRLTSLLKSQSWPKQSHSDKELAVYTLYERVLHDYFQNFVDDELDLAVSILETIICAQEAILVSDIPALARDTVSMSEEMASDSTHRLHAVLYVSGGRVYCYHKSFVDFIYDCSSFKDQKLKSIVMRMSMSDCHYHLTMKSFQLMRSLRFNICNLPSSFQNDAQVENLSTRIDSSIPTALQYACKFWAVHLLQIPAESHKEYVKIIFMEWLNKQSMFWMEAMSLLKLIGQCSFSLKNTRKWLGSKNGDDFNNIIAAEHLAAIFAGNVTVASTPHLYFSALQILPGSSGYKETWLSRLPGLPRVKAYLKKAEELLLISVTSQVFSVAFSPDETRVISGSFDGRVQIWDASTREQVHLLDGHTGSVNAVAFSPDGIYIVSGSHDRSVRIWNAITGGKVRQLDGHTESVSSVAFSPDGTRIVSGSGDRSVRIWNALTGVQVHQLDRHTRRVNSVVFSPDATRVVSGSYDNSLCIWNASTGEQIHQLEGHTRQINSIAFSPDGTHLVSGSHDQSVRTWNTLTGEQVSQLEGHTRKVNSVAFSPDGTCIVSGSDDRSVRVWNSSTGKQVHQFERHTASVTSVAYSSDGTLIISGSHDRTVRIWNASTTEDDCQVDGHTKLVSSVVFSPDGTRIVSGSYDKSVQIWDAITGEKLHQLDGHTDAVKSVAFSSDGTKIVSGSVDKSVRTWDVLTGDQVHQLDIDSDVVTSVALSSDGIHIVSWSYFSVQIWDASTGKKVHQLYGHTELVSSASFSPDGTQVISGSYDNSLRIWNVSSGEQVQIFTELTLRIVNSIAFSPDGTHVVSGSQDKSVRIWNASTGKVMHQLKGHTDPVCSVAFSPDGTHIVSGSQDGRVCIWEASTGKQVYQLNGHTWQVNSVAFSPNGTRIVSGSDDKSVRIWDILIGMDKPLIPDSSAKTWEVDANGWIISCDHEKYMWLSHGMRELINSPGCQVISSMGHVEVDFCSARLGDEWNQCYIEN